MADGYEDVYSKILTGRIQSGDCHTLNMNISIGITLAMWLIYIGYWTYVSAEVKRNRGEEHEWKSNHFALRMALFFMVVILFVFERHAITHVFTTHDIIPDDPIIGAMGTTLVVTGIMLATLSRWYLGHNWSSYPALKEGHELVTTGPYAVIRHPIYAGVLLAMLGSVLSGGVIWIFLLVLIACLFAWRIHKEDVLLSDEFGDLYHTYKHRTPALIPFLI